MHAFEEKIDKYICRNNMLEIDDQVVLGVSGGADSTALFFVLLSLRSKYNLRLKVVHINHGLRPEAVEEASIVRNLCVENDVEFVLREYDVNSLAKINKKSCEEMGRELRYKAFNEEAEEAKAKIAVAHNMNDLSETMLFNLFRGTGITGLSSISPVRDNVIRPLLCVTRDEIEQYLYDMNLSFCTDKSNFSDEYTRNRIRNNIIPTIKSDVSERAVEHMANTANQLRELGEYVSKCCDNAYKESLVRENDNEVVFSVKMINKQDIYLKKMLVKLAIDRLVPGNRDITSAHLESVAQLKEGQGYKEVNLPYNLVGFISYDETGLKLNSKAENAFTGIPLIAGQKNVVDELTFFTAEYVEYDRVNTEQNEYTKYLSCDTISNQMLLRTRREGDYIVVTGEGGRKKLKNYFIDKKVPADKRDKILLLADGNRVMWVVGYRIGEDCKVTGNTGKILKITLNKLMEDK